MKKTKLVAIFCLFAITCSLFVACDRASGDEKETALETVGKDQADENQTSESADSEKTNGVESEEGIDFESMSQEAAYKYVCDVIKKSSEQSKISAYYNHIPDESDPTPPEGFYYLFIDRTDGWMAYSPDPTSNNQGEWYKKDNGKYIRYVKDELINWETKETISYREILEDNKMDWEYDLFAVKMGLCTNEDYEYTGFMHVVNHHDCDVEITKNDENVTIRFTPLEPRLCDVCESNFSGYNYYEYAITDGLLSKATISGDWGYTVEVTYKCASFDVPDDDECPLKE